MTTKNPSERMMLNKDGEQLVWVVWEAVNGRPVLGVLCSNDAVLGRYISANRKERLGTGTPVFCEKVMLNHWYGADDMAIASRVMRRAST